MSAKSLSEMLLASAEAIGGRAIAEMYRDPFWDERFGPRGRRFSDEDSRHHVSYLAAALDANDPQVLTKYAHWLRGVLVSRGMCSRHLAENYRRLARAIEAEEIPGARDAAALLEQAITALLYPPGPSRRLQDASGEIAARLAAEWVAREPAPGAELRDRAEADLAQHLSYLADACACGRPELFVTYARFFAGFAERRGLPKQSWLELLGEIAREAGAIDPGLERIACLAREELRGEA